MIKDKALSDFYTERIKEIKVQGKSSELMYSSKKWMSLVNWNPYKYAYHFDWLNRPIIQYPQDIVAIQELIWQIKPDLIIETGIAHGGSLALSASILALLEYDEAVNNHTILDPSKPKRKVLGVDIDIRKHNRKLIEAHSMYSRMEMFEGSSIELEMIERVRAYAKDFKTIMLFLDSNHTHDHVLAELNAYANLVTPNSFCVVFGTIIEDLPGDMFPDRPWGKGNNPKTAVHEYLKSHPEFQVDKMIDNKLLISVAPDGYLKRVK